MEKERPGTMIYHDILPAVESLSREAAGELFVAILRYGKYGEIPDFSQSEGLNVAWNFVRPRIDRDKDRYAERILRNTYGLYKRESNRRGEEPLSFESWYQKIYLPTLEPGTVLPLSDAPAEDTQKDTFSEGQGRRNQFTPPTVEEVQAYCEERRNGVDPEAFVDFYSSKGWKVGNQKMKDWKAAVRTWERRGDTGRGSYQQGGQGAAPYQYAPGDTSGSL